MDYCNECRFFSDLGRCRNGSTRRNDVGYFQKACPQGLPKEYPPHETEQDHTEIAQDNPKIEHTMPAIEQPTTKVCKVCGKELPLDSFPKQVKSKDGHMNMCRDCFSAKHAHQKAEPAARAAAKAPDDEELDKILAVVPAKTLIAELHRRGWKGTLTFTLTETL